MGLLRRLLGSAPGTPVTAGPGFTGGWVCGSCRSVNPPGNERCHGCRRGRDAAGPGSFSGLQLDVYLSLSGPGNQTSCGLGSTRGHVHVTRCVGIDIYSGDQDGSAERSADIPAGLPGGVSGRGLERWTIDRCGDLVSYIVSYAPDLGGGTSFTISVPGPRHRHDWSRDLDARDPVAEPSWANLRREEQEELALGVWLLINGLAGRGELRDSEEIKAADPIIVAVVSSTRSSVVGGVFSLVYQGWDRMPDVFCRVAGIQPGGSSAEATMSSLPQAEAEAAHLTALESARGVLVKLPESDRRRLGAAVAWVARAMIFADSGSRSLPRDRKIVRSTNMLAYLGIDADADWAWAEANEI